MRVTHNKCYSREYSSWTHAKYRTTNPKNDNYEHYGGRGIKMCDSWLNSFENFYKDMGERPEGMTLDRIDVNGNYEPGNCRWAAQTTQTRNTRQRDSKSGVRGVEWREQANAWRARIKSKGKQYHLGHYKDIKDAINARKQAELRFWGDWA